MAVDAAHADFEFDAGTVGVCPDLVEIAGIVDARFSRVEYCTTSRLSPRA